jgi:hypothetical protein
MCLVAAAFSLIIGRSAQAGVVFETDVRGEEFPIGNMLEWRTLFEEDSRYFLVEKSEDGQRFEAIGNVDAAGHSNASKSYQFLDMAASGDKAMYRLKLMDANGAFTYSRVCLVKRSIPNNFSIVAMNQLEVAQTLELQLDLMEPTSVSYTLTTKGNKPLKSGTVTGDPGLVDLSIAFDELAPGTYKLVLDSKGEREELVLRYMPNNNIKKNTFSSRGN